VTVDEMISLLQELHDEGHGATEIFVDGYMPIRHVWATSEGKIRLDTPDARD
jgi:hypothetical protein